MSRYMLDTDTCIFITRKSAPSLLVRIESVPLEQQCISVVTLAELLYGVQVSSKKKANQEAVDLFAQHIEVLEWTQDAAKHYAEIRADLKKKGQQLGANDLLIWARQGTQGRQLDGVTIFSASEGQGRASAGTGLPGCQRPGGQGRCCHRSSPSEKTYSQLAIATTTWYIYANLGKLVNKQDTPRPITRPAQARRVFRFWAGFALSPSTPSTISTTSWQRVQDGRHAVPVYIESFQVKTKNGNRLGNSRHRSRCGAPVR